MGEQGVHIFLIASGFGLATSWWKIYQKNQKNPNIIALIPFWKRRLFRIFPLYWMAHGLALLIYWINPKWVPFGQEVWTQGGLTIAAAIFASLTTLRNFIMPFYTFLNGAWWYVGLIVQLYFIFPFLIRWGKRWGWQNLLISSIIISLLYRGLIVFLPLSDSVIDRLLRGAFFPSRLFEFVLGIVLAIALLERNSLSEPLLNWSRNLLFQRRWLGILIIIWGLGLAGDWASEETFMALRIHADFFLGIGEFFALFQLLNYLPALKRWLNPIGGTSYGIYLIHMNLETFLWVAMGFISFYWLRLFVVIAIACLLGGLFDLAGNWMIKQGLKNTPLSS
ncbi:hypothetical protein PCC9214_00836 [Planktothrix tepida]|uniref:Acyltransferase 3 domain-containing protein n=2 Tax=Planktothrix TaxID=54304 RepID=A0A1J1LEX6_9CYAN|nr:acyltransferase family protein [Planktothrix tepida]CAD5923831.1 hypothetical protein PCC9214_00836 [Planktothrix tepida]CUR31131.1 membrane hypothetical protein [Planktothrix tepida PCC 9214]